MFWIQVFWCLNWMNRRWQKRCTQLILGGRPVPVLVAMVNEALESCILTFWLIEELFYICIHLNHITSCNPLLNTILIVMGHVIRTCRNMMLFSRPVSYTKIPPVYIPTSITACTINRNYYYFRIFIILPVGPLENFKLVPELPKIHQVFHSIQKSKTIRYFIRWYTLHLTLSDKVNEFYWQFYLKLVLFCMFNR